MPNGDDMFRAEMCMYRMANVIREYWPRKLLHDPAVKRERKQWCLDKRADADNLDMAADAVGFIKDDPDLMRRFTAFRNGERRNG